MCGLYGAKSRNIMTDWGAKIARRGGTAGRATQIWTSSTIARAESACIECRGLLGLAHAFDLRASHSWPRRRNPRLRPGAPGKCQSLTAAVSYPTWTPRTGEPGVVSPTARSREQIPPVQARSAALMGRRHPGRQAAPNSFTRSGRGAARSDDRGSVIGCGPRETVLDPRSRGDFRAVEGADMVDHELIVRRRSLHL
jgi:hypothetical protein